MEKLHAACTRGWPYTFGSIVLSSDGKMAYPDPQGPLIAGKIYWIRKAAWQIWILNMLRATDATIIELGLCRLSQGHFPCFCAEWPRQELKMGKTDCPWNVIVSFDGTDIPLEHMILDTDEIEVRIEHLPRC